jgi:hypothetical protein
MFSTEYKRVIDYKSNTSMRFYSSPDFFQPSSSDVPLIYLDESAERYSDIDLDYFRKAMPSHTFLAYINFIGKYKIGFITDDFEEIYYPDEEE